MSSILDIIYYFKYIKSLSNNDNKMAKITYSGMWIDIKSLDKKDKRNYLISNGLFLVGAIFWGIHLITVDSFLGPAIEEDTTSSIFYGCVRALIIICWSLAAVFATKFMKTQDELMHRYGSYILAWGALSFVGFGMLMSVMSPYLNFDIGFYECFGAFAIGTGIGGFRFHKEYLSDGE